MEELAQLLRLVREAGKDEQTGQHEESLMGSMRRSLQFCASG